MNIDTGNLISQKEFESLTEDEKLNYIKVGKKSEKLEPSERLKHYDNKISHQRKEILKRRNKNKMRNKNRKLNKRK